METSKNSTRQLTLDELIYSQEGSPANPTASPESERERRTSATCGPRCCALFENAPRATSWAKTFAALLVGMEGWSSRRCALTWKLKGTPYNRSYFQLVPSAPPTEETESGLLLTPTTTERSEHPDEMRARAKAKGYRNGTKYNSLLSQVIYGNLLPTPTAFDYNTPRSQEAWDKAKEKHGDALQNPLKQMAAFNMLPTPAARDTKGPVKAGKRVTKTGKTQNYGKQLPNIVQDISGKGSQLSPLFVEEMMGFPKNWTALPFQNGDEKA